MKGNMERTKRGGSMCIGEGKKGIAMVMADRDMGVA